MDFIFTRDLQSDLLEVDKVFRTSLNPWWDSLYKYIKGLENDLTFTALPAMVLCSYKYLKLDRDLSIAMANLFRTVYLGNNIHNCVKDSEEGQKHNQDLQFNILIGDYIFGHILKLLLEAGTGHLLDIFSDMMCEISEGLTIEHKLKTNYQVAAEKTSGSLYATAFYSASRMAGMEEQEGRLYRQLGHNIGMAVESFRANTPVYDPFAYIHNCEEIFNRINKYNGLGDQSTLEKAVKEIHQLICSDKKAAVV